MKSNPTLISQHIPSKHRVTTKNQPIENKQKEVMPFSIVGIGASAGGFEAFTKLLENLPEKTNMAFVLIQHLDPTHESHLTELLARKTKMPVLEASDNVKVEQNTIYIIPPNSDITLSKGRLQLSERTSV